MKAIVVLLLLIIDLESYSQKEITISNVKPRTDIKGNLIDEFLYDTRTCSKRVITYESVLQFRWFKKNEDIGLPYPDLSDFNIYNK